ncbi:MAG: NEW3 domain-containing protein [Dehalococcoidales bacterium]|nr:NEW3 domain-containing protein [Dehalococcoidales bacterium]
MARSRLIRFLLVVSLLLTMFAALAGHAVAAQSVTGTLDLTTQFPVLRGKSGDSYEFTVSLTWNGSETRNFDLITTLPPQWTAKLTRAYPASEIASIRMEAYRDYPEQFELTLAPVSWSQPEPGEYVATLEARSGDLKKTIELTAAVTAVYSFVMTTESGNLNMEATAGDDNSTALVLVNTGTARIENITFSSSKQEDWEVIFTPDRVAALDPGVTQGVEVIVRPLAGKTIAGDYMITLRAESKDYSPDPLVIRVTVLTPAFWGWISILIVIAIIAGLSVFFWRLGRR